MPATAFADLDGWLKELTEREREHASSPGIAVAVTNQEEIVGKHVAGLRNLEEGLCLREGDLFQIGSASKTFAAVVTLRLCEEGALDLSERVKTLIPELNIPGELGDQIRISHLLSNTAGLPLGADHFPSSRYAVHSLSGFRLMTDPGGEYYDSNLGFQILGYALERVSGQSYSELVQNLVLDKLKMKDTVAAIRTEVRDRLALGYSDKYDDRPFFAERELARAEWFEYTGADSCVCSTTADVTAFLRMMLRAEQGGELLSRVSFREMITPRVRRSEESWYGYGTYNREIGGNRVVGHGGDMPGHQSMMLADLDSGIGVVVLCNGPGSPWRVARSTLVYCQDMLRGKATMAPESVYTPRTEVDLSEFVGEYFCGERCLAGKPHREGLKATVDGNSFILRQRDDPDTFHSDDHTHDLFLWRFERCDGDVVAVNHGSVRFTREEAGQDGAGDEEWASFSGHYRRFGPFDANFRVVPRSGQLLLVFPGSILCDSYEMELEHVEGRRFSVRGNLEHVEFDSLEDGRYTRAIYALSPYYRVD